MLTNVIVAEMFSKFQIITTITQLAEKRHINHAGFCSIKLNHKLTGDVQEFPDQA